MNRHTSRAVCGSCDRGGGDGRPAGFLVCAGAENGGRLQERDRDPGRRFPNPSDRRGAVQAGGRRPVPSGDLHGHLFGHQFRRGALHAYGGARPLGRQRLRRVDRRSVLAAPGTARRLRQAERRGHYDVRSAGDIHAAASVLAAMPDIDSSRIFSRGWDWAHQRLSWRSTQVDRRRTRRSSPARSPSLPPANGTRPLPLPRSS